MEKEKSYNPDRTVTINAGRGPSWGLVLSLIGILISFAALVGVAVVSLDVTADELAGTPSPQQELEVDTR